MDDMDEGKYLFPRLLLTTSNLVWQSIRDETSVAHITRYLKSIVIWLRACNDAIKLPRPVRAHFAVFPRPHVTWQEFQDHFAVMQVDILNHPRILEQEKGVGAYSDRLQTLCSRFLRSSLPRGGNTKYTGLSILHAEAALMALAYSSRLGAESLEVER